MCKNRNRRANSKTCISKLHVKQHFQLVRQYHHFLTETYQSKIFSPTITPNQSLVSIHNAKLPQNNSSNVSELILKTPVFVTLI